MKRNYVARCVFALWLLASSCAAVSAAQPSDAAINESALLALETRLRKIVSAAQPEAIVERTTDSLNISYRAGSLQRPLSDSSQTQQSTIQLGPGYKGFLLQLRLEKDKVFRRDPMAAQSQESYWTQSANRYDLDVLNVTLPANIKEKMNLPEDSWPVRALNKISERGIIEYYSSSGYPSPSQYTRYEFAVAIARLADKMLNNDGSIQDNANYLATFKTQELRDDFDALLYEFAPELTRLGLRYDATKSPFAGKKKYRYIDLRIAFGKGADQKLIAQMKQAVAGFAVESVKANNVKASTK